ncbi:MAG TPA: hypothetical protein VFM82_05810 [Flavobacteriaceae bacterium]|nr:hypothetical protein [Flavobacteriaceae bacterium]
MKKIGLCVLFFFPFNFFNQEPVKIDPVVVVEMKVDNWNSEIWEMNELLKDVDF